MSHKLVLRLITAENELLGWVEHGAVARGDGCLRSAGPVFIVVDAPGVPAALSIHWCELHVETRYPCPPGSVRVGEVVALFPAGDPMVTLGKPPVGLPAVSTKHAVSLGIPPGSLGAVGHAGG